MKKYLDLHAMKNINNRIILKIVDLYSEGLEVFSQFPDYIRQGLVTIMVMAITFALITIFFGRRKI